MATQRMIEFETTSDEGAERVLEALDAAFAALAQAEPEGVRLAYWRVPGGCRFMALIELADENVNPLLDLDATRRLTAVISDTMHDGYPDPKVVEPVGSYGFGRQARTTGDTHERS